MTTLITHLRPHLDDICAFWLLKRYAPEAASADMDFIATDARGGAMMPRPDVILVGVGRGEFDEHKGDIDDCAATLVLKHLSGRDLVPPGDRQAVEKIAAWVLLEDTGRLNTVELRSFTVPSIIEGFLEKHGGDSAAVTELGFAMLDGIFEMQQNEVRIERDWAKRKEFSSRFGKAVAIASDSRRVETYAYGKGFPLVAILGVARPYHSIRAMAESSVDLTDVAEALRAKDPKAEWYLHHSKKMIICGGDHAPGAPTSTLTLDDLVAALV